MEVQVYPGQFMKSLDIRKPHVIIAVNSPDEKPWEINRNVYCYSALSLRFNDIDRQKSNEHQLMTESQADEILDFILDAQNAIETVVVHCNLGMSRSPAIAAAIEYIFNGKGSDDIYFRRFLPNRHVFKTILQRAFERDVLDL